MDEEPLVRAMPRRPLYALRGLITKVDLAVLHAIDEEGWFATRGAIAADIDAKEVRLAVLVLRATPGRTEALAAADGRIAHEAMVGPECEGLLSLKALARTTAEGLVGGAVPGVELAGYLNDDAEPTLRHVFVLVYRVRLPVDRTAPPGLSWVTRGDLPAGLDPLSQRLAEAIG